VEGWRERVWRNDVIEMMISLSKNRIVISSGRRGGGNNW